MNAFLSSAARRAGSSTGYESSLSSKNFFSGLYGSSGSTTHSTLSGITSGGVYPKLELLINDHVLPTNMTIYQAIKQFGSSGPPVASSDQSMLTENDAENTSLINNAIWSKVHLIHYRIAQSSNTSASSSSTTTAAAATSEVSSKASTSKETDTKRSTRNSITKQQTSSTLPVVSKKQQSNTKNENDSSLDVATDSITNTSSSGLDVSLTNFLNKLTSSKSKLEENINDRSIDSILLLRLLSSVNREWLLMYKDVLSLESIFTFTNNTNTDLATQSSAFLTGMNEFVNTKLTAKANRQLQDPLVVMTGKIHKIIK
jgi:E3 ubiquitin-protein ligase TRIP12